MEYSNESGELSSESDLSKTFVCNYDVNENETNILDFRRFHYGTFNIRTLGPSTYICIDLKANKEITLHGVAFDSIIGLPAGEFSVSVGLVMSKYCRLLKMKLDFTTKKRTPRNYMNLGDVILQPNKNYRIRVEFSKEVSYYTCPMLSNVFHHNDVEVAFRVYGGHDVFSHFFFSECF